MGLRQPLNLEEEFCRLWPDKDLARRQWATLRGFYSEPERHYHTLQHLEECLSEPEIDEGPIDDQAVKLAIYYHDAVMIFSGEEQKYTNEELSAMLLIDHAQIQWVDKLNADINLAAKMIEMTAEHGQVRPKLLTEVHLMLDIDLAILGREEKRFDEYEAQIRREYAFVPDKVFYPARERILRSFLALSDGAGIYVTKSLKERYEERARANIQRSLAAIEARR
jgi:predicted metal-dependent HD superfamily phosphohydrolase